LLHLIYALQDLMVLGRNYSMRYLVLASDYDGTLAHDGVVDEETVRALERLIHSGRRLILVTGRELPDLQSVFPRLDLCHRVVAENGALVYNPATREKQVLAQRPPQHFLQDLRARGVSGVSVGEVIVATWHPYELQVIDAIRDSGLELQVIFNKEAVMILPSGVNKMTGLRSALDELKISRHNVVGVGDAENDHAFLDGCECSVAVANAIPALKEKVDFVTEGSRGAGVTELVDKLIKNELCDLDARMTRDSILVGKSAQATVSLPVHGRNILVCGQSGSGKSMLVKGLIERIIEKRYQICLIDPEGDYENLPGCRTVGDQKRPPSIEHVKQVLEESETQIIVNLVGVSVSDRPGYFASLISEIQHLRSRTGRPHWLIIDEAHHVLPSEWAPASSEVTEQLNNLLFITVHPEHVAPVALSKVNTVIVVGREPRKPLEEFANVIRKPIPGVQTRDLQPGEALLWFCEQDRSIDTIKIEPSREEHHRHRRKYAEGQLEGERVFHFTGPAGKMDLQAHNLNMFVHLADGIDTETWHFHLNRGDYSNWLRHALKDTELADEVQTIEKDSTLSDREGRARIKNAILQKYTAPA
jgi:hydroxymethylpyrimidine pyrophosphatase-like HAD family hydrolase